MPFLHPFNGSYVEYKYATDCEISLSWSICGCSFSVLNAKLNVAY